MSYQLYCLSHKNPERAKNMRERLDQIGFQDAIISTGVEYPDNRAWGCMLGHLDMLKQFLDTSDAEYVICCEDDIVIHKELKHRLPDIIQDCKMYNIDILLLGFLFAFPSDDLTVRLYTDCDIIKPSTHHSMYNYHDTLWGTQMFMLSRSQAQKMLEKYSLERAKNPVEGDPPFSADWTLTKDGNRALLWPMYALEDGSKLEYADEWQNRVHYYTYHGNINENYV
jgi:hypothetical protein